ncbi:MAG TPA: hypothetical protein VMC43_03590 [Candidatus Paceibacterota bacterium]|nr:hypothetical protein [Candidatus Paceibacterota bacterium]
MDKKLLGGVLAAVVLGAGIYFYSHRVESPEPEVPFDPANAAYLVDGQPVMLVNGKAETPAAPGSASKVKTMMFGTSTPGDLNKDGRTDAAFFLVQDTGGSGTFYYAAAALNTPRGAQGLNAVLLGDRVAPQTIEIKNGQVVANYAMRQPNEPMTTPPSIGVSAYITLKGSALEIVPPTVGLGARCGGNMAYAPVCMDGFHCAPIPGSHLPFGDVGGVCVKDTK